jgi:pimeloyl-ACP methyl ester carboxylesterase
VADGLRSILLKNSCISAPLTLAWPDHDRLVARPSAVPATAREVVLRDCGHMPTWDDPEQVAAVLLEGSAGPGGDQRPSRI